MQFGKYQLIEFGSIMMGSFGAGRKYHGVSQSLPTGASQLFIVERL
jgi:hypothetical protein